MLHSRARSETKLRGISGLARRLPKSLLQECCNKLPEINDVDRHHSGAIWPRGPDFAKRSDRCRLGGPRPFLPPPPYVSRRRKWRLRRVGPHQRRSSESSRLAQIYPEWLGRILRGRSNSELQLYVDVGRAGIARTPVSMALTPIFSH